MKAIEIEIEGCAVKKYSAAIEKGKWFEISERAQKYICAQSVDSKIYYADREEDDRLSCSENGKTRYYIKGHNWDNISPLAVPNDEDWVWLYVDLKIINIMD